MPGQPERALGAGRFGALLGALGALFVAYPVLVELGVERGFRLAFAAVLLVAVYALSRERWILRTGALLAAPAVVAQVLAFARQSADSRLAATLLTLAFVVFLSGVAYREVLRAGPVDGDRIAGAICVYLLLGLLFANLHALVDLLQAGAYEMVGRAQGEQSFLYFSFTTLTTLGYGDLVPRSPLAQTLSWMEAVVGQLFLAITIARLVALEIAGRKAGSGESSAN